MRNRTDPVWLNVAKPDRIAAVVGATAARSGPTDAAMSDTPPLRPLPDQAALDLARHKPHRVRTDVAVRDSAAPGADFPAA